MRAIAGRSIAALGLAAWLGACSPPHRDAARDAPSAAASAPAPPPAAPAPRVAARHVHEENDFYEFDYAYPREAAAIPALKAWLDGDLEKQRAELAESAKEGRTDAKADDFPFNPYSSEVKWSRVADLPGWLSLSADLSEFTGGAHPNHGFAALLWDKAANRRRAAVDLFASKAAFSAAISPAFCDEIDQERAARRGEPVNRNSTDPFDLCPDPANSTVILGSSNHATFDRIGILIAPYEAGPYAEGIYEVSLPVTPALLAAVRPEYRAAFSLKR